LPSRVPYSTVVSLTDAQLFLPIPTCTTCQCNLPMKPEDTGKKPSDNVLLDKAHHFQAIVQLLQLVLALLPGDEHKHKSDKLKVICDTRKSFDFKFRVCKFVFFLFSYLFTSYSPLTAPSRLVPVFVLI
jgi:hypothetical protein